MRRAFAILLALALLGALSAAAGAEGASAWVNYLFIGLDVEPRDLGVPSDYDYLADMLLIVSMNEAEERVKVIALDCDIPVAIAGHGEGEIGAAYYYGGPELTVQTVNAAYGLSIEKYMVCDPFRMAELIDAIGGVTVDLSKAERNATNRYLKQVFGTEAISAYGEDTPLTGPQAVSYGGNWDVNPAVGTRVDREFEVVLQTLRAIANKGVEDIAPVLKAIAACVDTNLTAMELATLAAPALNVDPGTLEYMRISHADGKDPAIDKALIDEFIHLDSPYPVLYRGSPEAEAVKVLQEKLNEHGAGLAVDGDFGVGTRAALMKYQEDNGLVVSGVCGYGTWNLLLGD